MSGSLHRRKDSPYPVILLDSPPPPQDRKSRHMREVPNASSYAQGDNHSPTPNPPLSTRYIDMLLERDEIPTRYNIFAGVFTWLLLAGYMVFPGAFTSIRNSRLLADGTGKAGKVVLKAAQNLPLLWIAAICCVLGAFGMSWLGWLWKRNYIWIISRIILPGLSNSVVGLFTTIMNIYTARSGFWSVAAIATATVTGSSTTILIALFIFFRRMLNQIIDEHERKKEEAERVREGLINK